MIVNKLTNSWNQYNKRLSSAAVISATKHATYLLSERIVYIRFKTIKIMCQTVEWPTFRGISCHMDSIQNYENKATIKFINLQFSIHSLLHNKDSSGIANKIQTHFNEYCCTRWSCYNIICICTTLYISLRLYSDHYFGFKIAPHSESNCIKIQFALNKFKWKSYLQGGQFTFY